MSRNFIVDHPPGMENVWIVGAGSAEGFKFGPVMGEYAANRIAGHDREPELAQQFAIPTAVYEATPPARSAQVSSSRQP